jgi:hypothetical protein
MLKKKCKICSFELPVSRFYWLGYFKKKSGEKAYSSYCNACNSKRLNPNRKGEYRPHKVGIRNKDIKEEIIVDVRSIYLLLKRIEINNLQLSYIDSFKLVDEYVKVFGSDIPEYYCEIEQLDIMYYKLKEYIDRPL